MKPQIITHLISFLLGCIAILFLSLPDFDCGEKRNSETIFVHDTTTLERYESRIDTIHNNIIKNLISKESEPTIIYQEKISYRDIEKFKDYDLSLGFEKKGTTLRIWAVNINDSLIKEQVFEEVFGNFTAYSSTDRIIVKSEKYKWKGVNIGFQHERPISDLKNRFNNKVDITTGLSYKEKYSLDIGGEYDLNQKDLKLKVKAGVRLF